MSTIHIKDDELWGPRYKQSYKSWNPPTRNNRSRYPFTYDDTGDDWEDQRNGYQLETMLTRDIAGFLGIADIITQELYGTKVNIQPERLLGLLRKPFEITSQETKPGPDGKIYKNDFRKNITLLDVFTNAQKTLTNLLNDISNSAKYVPVIGEIADDISAIVSASNDKLDQLLPIPAILNEMKKIANDAKNQQRLIQASSLALTSSASPSLPKIASLSGKPRIQAQMAELEKWYSVANSSLNILAQNYHELNKNIADLKKVADDPSLDPDEAKDAENEYQNSLAEAKKIKDQIDNYNAILDEIDRDKKGLKKGITNNQWEAMVRNYGNLAPNIAKDNTSVARINTDLSAKITRLLSLLSTLTGSPATTSSMVSPIRPGSSISPPSSVPSISPVKPSPKKPIKKLNFIIQLWNDLASGYDIPEAKDGSEFTANDFPKDTFDDDSILNEMYELLIDENNYKTGIRTFGKTFNEFKNKFLNQGYSIYFNPKGATLRKSKK